MHIATQENTATQACKFKARVFDLFLAGKIHNVIKVRILIRKVNKKIINLSVHF